MFILINRTYSAPRERFYLFRRGKFLVCDTLDGAGEPPRIQSRRACPRPKLPPEVAFSRGALTSPTEPRPALYLVLVRRPRKRFHPALHSQNSSSSECPLLSCVFSPGAIYAYETDMTITGGTVFTNNKASASGGKQRFHSEHRSRVCMAYVWRPREAVVYYS